MTATRRRISTSRSTTSSTGSASSTSSTAISSGPASCWRVWHRSRSCRPSTAASTCRGPMRRSATLRPGWSPSAPTRRPPTRTCRGPGSSTTASPSTTPRSIAGAGTGSASSAGWRPRRGSSRRSRSRSRPDARCGSRPRPGRCRPSRTTSTTCSRRRSKAAGDSVEFLGELEQADRDLLFAESYASLMPGSWPEPFGLVAIEALACGTPIIARRVGAPARDHPRRRRRVLRR